MSLGKREKEHNFDADRSLLRVGLCDDLCEEAFRTPDGESDI